MTYVGRSIFGPSGFQSENYHHVITFQLLEFEFGIVKSYMTIFYTNCFPANPESDLLFFMLEQIMLQLFVIIHRFDNALKRFLTLWIY